MNIEHSEYYDQEDDVYYVTFATGEPSRVRETDDDNLLIEVGMFSNLPTGFRILNFKKAKITSLRFSVEKAEQVFQSAKRNFALDLDSREKRLQRALEKVFA